MNAISMRGVLSFPVTPMNEDGSRVDLPAYQSLVRWQLDSGVHGVVALGSTGEFAYLRPAERNSVVDATVEAVGGQAPAVIGVSAISTGEAVEYAQYAQKAGADAVMLSLPTYYALTDEEVYEHVAAVAAAAALPVVLYNNPYTSQVDVTPDLLESLLTIDSIVAVKEASIDINRISALHVRFGDRLDILGGGFDPYALPGLCAGATGWTSALANLTPAMCVELYTAAAVERDLLRARAIHHELLPLANLLVELRLSVVIKAALRLIGRPVGGPRRPLRPLPARDEERLRSVLSQLKLTGTSGP